jgi:BolA protein
MSTKDAIINKLREAFLPESLDVVDESHLHEGHAGHSPGGETHFRVYIVSPAFEGKSRIERHRMINAALTAFVDSQGLNWDIVIRTILYAMRNSYHTAIGDTPFNVFMGRQAREPTDIIFGNVSVLLDLADNDMITHPLRLRQLHDEVSQFSADLLRASISSRLKVDTQLRLSQVIELCCIPPFCRSTRMARRLFQCQPDC